MGNHGCIIRIQPKSLHSKGNDTRPEVPTFVILIFKGKNKQTNKIHVNAQQPFWN